MPVDFFLFPCNEASGHCNTSGFQCLSSSSKLKFGLCDDPPPSNLPAYIDEINHNIWIAEVSNPNAKEIKFKPIDSCVNIIRTNGELESRCDGVLIDGNRLIFVELKDRASAGWLSKGRDQLTITIDKFKQNHNINSYAMIEAYVSNKQRPLAVTSINSEIQKFFNDTGLLLRANRNITI